MNDLANNDNILKKHNLTALLICVAGVALTDIWVK